VTVDALIDAGNLTEAIGLLGAMVGREPLNFRHRTYLFALLCFGGDYQRAQQQLQVMAQENETTALAAAYYEKLLRATADREQVFRKGLLPRFLGEPPAYAHVYGEALRALADGDQAAGAALLAAGEAQRRRCPVSWNDEALADLRDADDRLGPFVELLLDDAYVWVPLEQVRSIQVGQLSSLRDLFWVPLRVVTAAGAFSGVMPALYPGSPHSADERARLGQMTLWVDNPHGLSLGLGQRLFASGEHDLPALELRRLLVEVPVAAPAASA
jgi:type VI secretion system protein ImpE